MTDAHFHRSVYDTYLSFGAREMRFFGRHPWQAAAVPDPAAWAAELTRLLDAEPAAGVGEIGLDRLRTKTVPENQRTLFAAQLAVAAEKRRPVTLHGAKCWGEVVSVCRAAAGRVPAFLFHGFSRSGGLLPEIVALNGFVSVGPALLNDHAVNYRDLVRALPADRLLVESDLAADDPAADRVGRLAAVFARLAELRGLSADALETLLAANLARFAEVPA